LPATRSAPARAPSRARRPPARDRDSRAPRTVAAPQSQARQLAVGVSCSRWSRASPCDHSAHRAIAQSRESPPRRRIGEDALTDRLGYLLRPRQQIATDTLLRHGRLFVDYAVRLESARAAPGRTARTSVG